jgi:hypothetical protein
VPDVSLSVRSQRPAQLTDDPDDEIGGAPVLEIESHEEGFLARILLAEGEDAAPDEAIAVIVEREEHVAPIRDAFDAARAAAAGRPILLVEAGTFAWQAYLASGYSARQCGNS